MKLTLIALLIAFASFGSNEKRPEGPQYRIVKTEHDKKLRKKQSAFTFLLTKVVKPGDRIVFADNDKQDTIKVSKDLSFSIKTTPGKHIFAFYYNSEYKEIFTDSIEVKPQYRTTVQLMFRSAHSNIQVRKPVIYLYPESKTEVEVKIKPKGELFFSYPEYDKGWNVIAEPDGTITHKNEKLNYLFWESEQDIPGSLMKLGQGYYIKGRELTQFFEEVLTEYGLTSQEQQDFITYWVPIMKDNPFLYIYFLFDEECDAFGELNISPKPDNTGRIYMLWADAVLSEKGQLPKPQNIPKLNRNGFTAIEWGGANFVN
jgi:hypothetical protein